MPVTKEQKRIYQTYMKLHAEMIMTLSNDENYITKLIIGKNLSPFETALRHRFENSLVRVWYSNSWMNKFVKASSPEIKQKVQQAPPSTDITMGGIIDLLSGSEIAEKNVF